ncbi:UNVERIFIED_CONTAM: hypothetical protein RMT77_012395 [Armadillidium vulgare]
MYSMILNTCAIPNGILSEDNNPNCLICQNYNLGTAVNVNYYYYPKWDGMYITEGGVLKSYSTSPVPNITLPDIITSHAEQGTEPSTRSSSVQNSYHSTNRPRSMPFRKHGRKGRNSMNAIQNTNTYGPVPDTDMNWYSDSFIGTGSSAWPSVPVPGVSARQKEEIAEFAKKLRKASDNFRNEQLAKNKVGLS